MFVIGIDPHRGSHAAAVLDGDECVRSVLQLVADREQTAAVELGERVHTAPVGRRRGDRDWRAVGPTARRCR